MSNTDCIKTCGPFILLLAAANSTALAQDRTTQNHPPLLASLADQPREDHWRDSLFHHWSSSKSVRVRGADWGTGGFKLQGERIKSGSKSTAIGATKSQWRRTYAVDAAFWQDAAPGIVLAAGAHVSRAKSGTSDGPMLTRSTKLVTRSAYIGAQIGDAASVKLIAFDDGNLSRSDSNDIIIRTVNGERIARKGAAVEIGIFAFEPQVSDAAPEFRLRLENARTAFGKSDSTASLSLKMHF